MSAAVKVKTTMREWRGDRASGHLLTGIVYYVRLSEGTAHTDRKGSSLGISIAISGYVVPYLVPVRMTMEWEGLPEMQRDCGLLSTDIT